MVNQSWTSLLPKGALLALVLAACLAASQTVHRKDWDSYLWTGAFYTVFFSLLLFILLKMPLLRSGPPAFLLPYSLLESGMWLVCYIGAYFLSDWVVKAKVRE